MSGECDECGEHTTDCRCNMNDIKIWAQMFFEDGSVTQGTRVMAEILEEENAYCIPLVAENLLKGVNREEGWLLLWGAGNMRFLHYPTSFSGASDSSASESEKA